jgi:hypothetical protein
MSPDAGERMKKLKPKLERAHRPDYHFAVASVALMVFMVVAGFGAWVFGSRAANVDPPARHSTAR